MNGSIRSVVRTAGKPRDHADVIHLAALYDEVIASVDAEVGRLVEALERSGRRDDALIVVLSDHGEAFNQHGITGHNAHVYEEMVRVPLIFSAPGSRLAQGHTVAEPVSLLDVAPTLRELFDLPAPRHRWSGHSLDAELGGGRAHGRATFLSSRYVVAPDGPLVPRQYGVVVDGYKLVADENLAGWELYDLAADPEEQHDLASALPDRVQTMRAALEARLSEMLGQTVPAAVVDGVDEKALSELGYVGGEAAGE